VGFTHQIHGHFQEVDITAGLLFYTSRDDLIRVRAVKDELRHLMMARNRLARYMHSEPSYSPEASLLKPTDIPDLEDLTAEHVHAPEHPILPEPIDSERGCCKCFEVEGCMLYRKVDLFFFF
jgi:DNA replication ATP-dependent helicase Dna2